MSKFNTLRTRLILWIMLINTALLAVLVGAGWLLLRREQDAALNNTLKLSATQLTTAVDKHDDQLVASADEVAVLAERGVFGWIVDTRGKVHGIIGHAPQSQPPDMADVAKDQLIEHTFVSSGHARLFRTQLAEVKGDVIVGVSTQSLDQTASRALLTFFLALPVTLALTAFGGLFVAGRALSPIAAITAQAQRISRDNLAERLSLAGPDDEVLQLARTFDTMLDRLQHAFENERRFTADASHELRTPLALMKAQLTLALNRPRDAHALTQMLRAMDGDVDRMTRLVTTLLSLARTDEPLSQRKPVDLVDLLDSLVNALQMAYASRHIAFVLHAPASRPASPAFVLGDADLLNQLFLNLLDNAAKYSPDHSAVTVSITSSSTSRSLSASHAAYWQIDVADKGMGIAAEHLPHLFDRFYRVDESRARQSGGTGLGLPIAQAIAKQHDGQITVNSVPGAGSTFSVRLPRESPTPALPRQNGRGGS
jgi:signal transduction histidine kinase